MSLEQLWTKLEEEKSLTTREENEFTEKVSRGIDELENLMDNSKED